MRARSLAGVPRQPDALTCQVRLVGIPRLGRELRKIEAGPAACKRPESLEAKDAAEHLRSVAERSGAAPQELPLAQPEPSGECRDRHVPRAKRRDDRLDGKVGRLSDSRFDDVLEQCPRLDRRRPPE